MFPCTGRIALFAFAIGNAITGRRLRRIVVLLSSLIRVLSRR
ncbi:hypothetical protein LINPERHAP1_LOCUS24895 [Linum perenne]